MEPVDTDSERREAFWKGYSLKHALRAQDP
jgi:hypothetical protein